MTVRNLFWKPALGANRVRRTYLATRSYSNWLHGLKTPAEPSSDAAAPHGELRTFFEERRKGPGIWKWLHYFEIYERHLARFRNASPNILEIGIYSGGSLDMWRSYFGKGCHVYGADIEPSCKVYEKEDVTIFIGDQADRSFWARFRQQAPKLDIVIDDGGHRPHQQIATLEELVPHLQPGGVFICEDILGKLNPFSAYVGHMTRDLHACTMVEDSQDPERRLSTRATALQSAIASVHVYPFVTVIERNSSPVREFVAPKHGSEWQPFLS